MGLLDLVQLKMTFEILLEKEIVFFFCFFKFTGLHLEHVYENVWHLVS